ncbi:MAG TPA: hypothetical protein VKH46_07310 [Thermoanaerobaculia bacterium]|jgi:hypothetical protein|nr:hypothetical protein [Thermoanaerobaculia bacterium]
MNSVFSAAGSRPPGEIPPRPPGEMPPIDPDSMETDETVHAVIVRNGTTGKLTVGRPETRPPTDSTPTLPEAAKDDEGDKSKNRDR